MQGKIIKGIAGFYYVKTASGEIYACKAKGIFRKEGQKPLVGDDVRIQILHEEDKEGNVEEILPRKNQLIRPAVSNVDQAVVIFAMNDPRPNLMLLDRFLISMEYQQVPTVICFNKADLGSEKECRELQDIYTGCGYQVLMLSAATGEGVEEFRRLLVGKTSVVAGPSGVGKSSLTNLVQQEDVMETGEISRKLGRGRHTTRHSQLLAIGENSYIVDTPGFSSLYIEGIEKEELKKYFTEFIPYEGGCRFLGCVHIHEPDCQVKAALEQGKISSQRYENYLELYQEINEKRRY